MRARAPRNLVRPLAGKRAWGIYSGRSGELGARLEASFYLLNKKNSFKTAELVRAFSLRVACAYRAALESCWELTFLFPEGLGKATLRGTGAKA